MPWLLVLLPNPTNDKSRDGNGVRDYRSVIKRHQRRVVIDLMMLLPGPSPLNDQAVCCCRKSIRRYVPAGSTAFACCRACRCQRIAHARRIIGDAIANATIIRLDVDCFF